MTLYGCRSNSEFDDNNVDSDVEAFWRLFFIRFKSAKHLTMPDIQALVFKWRQGRSCDLLGVRIDSGIVLERVPSGRSGVCRG